MSEAFVLNLVLWLPVAGMVCVRVIASARGRVLAGGRNRMRRADALDHRLGRREDLAAIVVERRGARDRARLRLERPRRTNGRLLHAHAGALCRMAASG